MIVEIPGVFSPQEAQVLVEKLRATSWIDGKITAGALSQRVKHNRQLDGDNPLGREIGDEIINRLAKDAVFMSAALPKRIYPPLFNRYGLGESFGFHIDNAVRGIRASRERVRTDLSATLFLSDPESYDGGELVIRDTYGEQRVKLKAGSMILYPGSSVHKVEPVTRGERMASFFWIESLVRDDAQRSVLLDMDVAIQRLTQQEASEESLVQLTGCYHNLLRMWADC
ncbi:Fe2+-dependent dioxygenase [Paraburkholderia bannensis]|uniref:Fe2+-dependent dioxygenase n=1 Tax=Paraburkholderia bannensis TaxID=765414 RepID=UPI002AB6809C|nr:Fe2+-dependent dioxygenase [Paraburkholderia bannensis]